MELICCSVDGEVRGYLSSTTVAPGGGVGGGGREEIQDHWKQLESLAQRKQVRPGSAQEKTLCMWQVWGSSQLGPIVWVHESELV